MSQVDEAADDEPLALAPQAQPIEIEKPQSPKLEAQQQPQLEEEEQQVDDTDDGDDPMEEDASASVSPSPVFCIGLKQPRSDLLHKMSVPELCRNFRYCFSWNQRSNF